MSTVNRYIVLSAMAVIVLGLSLWSLMIGPAGLTATEVLAAALGMGDPAHVLIVQELRLPRVALGLFAGASLGLSGAALQGLLRNPLADPGVIGVSSSAGLGAVIAIYFGLAQVFPLSVQLMAMAGALVATLILFYLSLRDSSILTLILAGVGISALAGAALSLVMNFAPTPMNLQDMVMWMLGSLDNRTSADLAFSAPFMLLGALCLLGVGQGLNATTLGEETAQSLGINLRRLRLQVVIGSAFAVGATVAACGAIGFVGLVVPHVMRGLVGAAPGRLLWPSALGGAILLTVADLLTRIPVGQAQLRLGVVTAFIGAPLFLYIIYRTRETMR
ncbi:MAG: ABC transporter permease [Kordiimonas sp.]|nr:ABC transporter permease [Kordiimonas sp.]